MLRRRFSRNSYFGALERTCTALLTVLLVIAIMMGGVTSYYTVTLPAVGASALAIHEREDARRWTIAVGAHLAVATKPHEIHPVP